MTDLAMNQLNYSSKLQNQIDNLYERRLTAHLLQVLEREPVLFCDLVRRAGGAYPTDVLSALRSLVAQGKIVEESGTFLLAEQAYNNRPTTENPELTANPSGVELGPIQRLTAHAYLADPHPADYDWRYTSSSLAELTRRLDPLLRRSANIALFGATTLFSKIASERAAVTLFDRSPSLLEDLNSMGFTRGLVQHDLFYPIKDATSDYEAVVADPPWYPEFHRAFMLRAAELLQSGGALLLSVLPWLARPSAIEDRANILEFSIKAGFDLREVIPGILSYESPKFERIALKIHGIQCDEWRSGDLYVFRKVNEPEPGLLTAPPDDEPSWDEFRLDHRKIKVRNREEPKGTRFSIFH